MVDIKCPLMVVFEWGPDQQVSVAVVVEVGSHSHGVAKPSILGFRLRLQGPVRAEAFLRGDRKRRTIKSVESVLLIT